MASTVTRTGIVLAEPIPAFDGDPDSGTFQAHCGRCQQVQVHFSLGRAVSPPGDAQVCTGCDTETVAPFPAGYDSQTGAWIGEAS
jgi:hypothetical protein